jgi:hypothetical protein
MNTGTYVDDASRKSNAIYWAKDTIKNNLVMPYRWYRDSHISNIGHIKTIRHNRKQFAKSFAIAVQNDDADYALELANEARPQHGRILNNPCDVLHDKFGGCYYSCDDCGAIVNDDDTYSVNDGDRSVCETCRDDNYHYSDYHNCYVDDDYESDNGGFENIGEYHSSSDNLGHIPSKYDNRNPAVLLGLELEMEIDSSHSLDGRAGVLLENVGNYRDAENDRYTYALCEQDGSLDNGFEMVTAYTGLDVHKEQLQFFKEKFEGAKSHNTSTCGLHIHICKADMSTLHACKMVFFINDADNQKLVYALARRDSSSYSKIHDKKGDKHWLKDAMQAGKKVEDNNKLQKRYQLRNLNSDRYEALNFKNDKTIEFRLFKGSLKYQTIMACLEFTFATWHFCKDASQTQLTTAEFLKFICRAENRCDTRFLRTYLKEKGFDLPEKDKPSKKVFEVVQELDTYDSFGVNTKNSFNTEPI